jgi:beta-carotene ketolase (CrtW type)
LTSSTRRGLALAAGLVLGWLGSWAVLLPTTLFQLSPVLVVVGVLCRTLLQTGLFIVAHDAMHGSLWPNRPEANRRIGETVLLLYAALPYGRCRRNHGLHHRHAGTPRDPDHHSEGQPSLWRWYGRFMAAYLSPGQLTLLVLSWLSLTVLAVPVSASPVANVVLYGVLPTLLSSAQLFLVGTFLPHRTSTAALHAAPPSSPAGGLHQPRSLDWPAWLSLLSCYHFGYHWEHHAYPHLAWHELPAARRQPPVRV